MTRDLIVDEFASISFNGDSFAETNVLFNLLYHPVQSDLSKHIRYSIISGLSLSFIHSVSPGAGISSCLDIKGSAYLCST